MNIWISSMECATIAEAGGVKNVVYSLCNELKKLNHNVTLFIPKFYCTSFSNISDLNENIFSASVYMCQKNEEVTFSKGRAVQGGFDVVFVNHPSFAEKEAVYTYTENEEKVNPNHRRGTGHEDTLFLDTLFAKSVASYAENVESIDSKNFPNVIHCQDASTATIPLYVKNSERLKNTKTIVTIHNAGPAYHHNFANVDEASWYTGFDIPVFVDCLNSEKPEPFLIANKFGAALTTVSETYATEIMNPEFSEQTEGLSKLFFEKKISIKGITNGIDYDLYNPTDTKISKLPFAFNPEKNDLDGKLKCRKYFLENCNSNTGDFLDGVKKYGSIIEPENTNESLDTSVYISYHGRIASQKGLRLLHVAIKPILKVFPNTRFIITGQGEHEIENDFIALSKECDGKIIFLNGYNKTAARLSVAACDFIVLPSFFEPCGLEDFIAQIYGTLPVAHKTGGLTKILDEQTGFLYEENSPECLIAKLAEVISIKMRCPNIIDKMISFAANYVHQNYEWKSVVERDYLTIFQQ